MSFLKLDEKYLRQKGAQLTASEIAGQPQLWEATHQLFLEHIKKLQQLLSDAYSEIDNIILTGAGTSAFIGLSLEGVFFRQTKVQTRAIPTTHIVSHPNDYFNDEQVSLVVSFARSGNSPESCAAIELADKFSKKCFHIIITCDANGALAHLKTINPRYVFVLPATANDKSLAMTGSYSAMLLSGLMIAYIHHPAFIKTQLQLITRAAQNILSGELETISEIAAKDFKRAVFLGSGNLLGTATEAALKLQELTNGKIICKQDSYLGLRHGPKAVINEQTLVVYFLSSDDYVRRYEEDLINTMKDGNHVMLCLAVGDGNAMMPNTDEKISFGMTGEKIHEDFLPVCSIIAGQLLGFYKSIQLGLSPDNPSVNGAISRVVQGVNIYPVETKKQPTTIE